LHIIETKLTAPIQTKFCTVTRTTKIRFVGGLNRRIQIQYGGRPPSWKIEKWQLIRTVPQENSPSDIFPSPTRLSQG